MLNIFERSMLMRGFEQLLLDLAANKAFVHTLFQKLMELNIAVYDEFLRIAGTRIDAIRTADDLGSTQAPLISARMYREMLQPYHKEWFRCIKERSPAPIIFHSDGAVAPLLPDLIEAGIDALNPVQVFAKDMDTARLKAEFGEQLSFWGGVDTVNILPHALPEEVAREVRQRIHDLALGGGYVLAGVHNLQPDVPPENIIAMAQACLEYSKHETTKNTK
jgi:uroporphyrinogen decarboxylase